MNRFVKISFFGILSLFSLNSFGQVVDDKSPGLDLTAPDSTVVDSSMVTEQSNEGNGDPMLKPYERITLYIDSATNLITYFGVVEQEESGSDSLYIRAKRWVTRNLGKEIKVEVDKRNQKLCYIGSIPAYAYMNKYSKRSIGRFEFKITFLIKEGRYKYQITNLVHESLKPSEGGKSNRNYFEYYYTATSKVRENDIILRNADRDIQLMVENIKKSLKDPLVVDEDDW